MGSQHERQSRADFNGVFYTAGATPRPTTVLIGTNQTLQSNTRRTSPAFSDLPRPLDGSAWPVPVERPTRGHHPPPKTPPAPQEAPPPPPRKSTRKKPTTKRPGPRKPRPPPETTQKKKTPPPPPPDPPPPPTRKPPPPRHNDHPGLQVLSTPKPRWTELQGSLELPGHRCIVLSRFTLFPASATKSRSPDTTDGHDRRCDRPSSLADPVAGRLRLPPRFPSSAHPLHAEPSLILTSALIPTSCLIPSRNPP